MRISQCVLDTTPHCRLAPNFIPFMVYAVEQFAASRLVVELRVRALGLGRGQPGRPQLQQRQRPWRSLCEQASSLAIPGPSGLRSRAVCAAAHLPSGKEVGCAFKSDRAYLLQAMAFKGQA